MYLFILIVSAVIWLSVAAVFRALRQRHPWQLLQGDRKRVQMVRGLEHVRHGLALLYWAVSVYLLVHLTIYLQTQDVPGVVLVVIGLAVAAELFVRVAWVQTQALIWLYVVISKYGPKLYLVYKFLELLESVSRRVSVDQPVFRDRRELTHLVRHHHQVHQILSPKQQRQVDALLKIESQPIHTKIIPLDDAQLVKAEEVIGPLVLAELHDSPYASFPVYAKRRAKIVGILDQGVAVSHAAHSTKVADMMEERVVFLPHDATTLQALQTFIETSSPISVIIDDEKQPVGVLYVQDILRDLFERTEETHAQK